MHMKQQICIAYQDNLLEIFLEISMIGNCRKQLFFRKSRSAALLYVSRCIVNVLAMFYSSSTSAYMYGILVSLSKSSQH